MKKMNKRILVFLALMLLLLSSFAVAEGSSYVVDLEKAGNSTMLTLTCDGESKSFDIQYDDVIDTSFNFSVDSVETIEDLISYMDNNLTTSINQEISQKFADQQTWFSGSFLNVQSEIGNLTADNLRLNLSYKAMESKYLNCDFKLNVTESQVIPLMDEATAGQRTEVYTALIFLVISIFGNLYLLLDKYGVLDKFKVKARDMATDNFSGITKK